MIDDEDILEEMDQRKYGVVSKHAFVEGVRWAEEQIKEEIEYLQRLLIIYSDPTAMPKEDGDYVNSVYQKWDEEGKL